MRGDAEGVHAEHLAPLLQTLGDGRPQARQQDVALPQTVDVNRKCSEVLGEHQLQDRSQKSSTAKSARQNRLHLESGRQRFKRKKKTFRSLLVLTCPADTRAEQLCLRYDANASVTSVCSSSLSSCRGRSKTVQ